MERKRKEYKAEFDREKAEECVRIWQRDKHLIKLFNLLPKTYTKKYWREPIVNVTTGKIYNNARQVEKITGINHMVISKVCRHIKSYNTANGYEWEYLSTIESYVPSNK